MKYIFVNFLQTDWVYFSPVCWETSSTHFLAFFFSPNVLSLDYLQVI